MHYEILGVLRIWDAWLDSAMGWLFHEVLAIYFFSLFEIIQVFSIMVPSPAKKGQSFDFEALQTNTLLTFVPPALTS